MKVIPCFIGIYVLNKDFQLHESTEILMLVGKNIFYRAKEIL